MLEGIPLGLVDLGGWGLWVITIFYMFRRLVTRRWVPEQDLLDEQAEKASWRAAYEKEREARGVADQQVGDLIGAVGKSNELGELTVAMLTAMRDRAQT